MGHPLLGETHSIGRWAGTVHGSHRSWSPLRGAVGARGSGEKNSKFHTGQTVWKKIIDIKFIGLYLGGPYMGPRYGNGGTPGGGGPIYPLGGWGWGGNCLGGMWGTGGGTM